MSMENNQLSPSSQNSFSQLVLVDEEYVLEHQHEDLYDLLIKEPSFIHKESLKYDYRPNVEVLDLNDQKAS